MASEAFAETEFGRWRREQQAEAAASHRRLLEQIPPDSRPAAVYVAEDSCPFECCQFGEWKARQPLSLYSRPRGKAVVGRVKKGEAVEALTGRSYVEPVPYVVVFRPEHPAPDDSGATPQVQWLLNYLGEGAVNVWRDGKVVQDSIDNDLFDVCAFPSWDCAQESLNGRNFGNRFDEWWKKIKTRRGIVGWTRENAFDGMDACGG